ncbi:UNVERIFIED_CONTAM: hypothetical protein GTU68_064930 [Idotea baltica]
MRFP